MHLEIINNGMGAPSMYMMVLAGQGIIPCDVVITSDTGSENDCLLSNETRTTAQDYYNDIIEPLGNELGLLTKFVRARDGQGNDLPSIWEKLEGGIIPGVPTYGSRGGQLPQGCTAKWKVAAVRQEARRMGAKTARSALGITMDEVHRMKQHNDVKWHWVWWPLIDMKLNLKLYKSGIRDRLNKLNIPFMLSSECDFCPHKNRPRWERTSPEMIDKIAQIEDRLGGTQFFTSRRIPLKMAIKDMTVQPRFSDFCDSGYCHT